MRFDYVLLSVLLIFAPSNVWADEERSLSDVVTVIRSMSSILSIAEGTFKTDHGDGPYIQTAEDFSDTIMNCWSVNMDDPAATVMVQIGFSLLDAGKVDYESIRLLHHDAADHDTALRAFEAGRRAIVRCQKGGYQILPEKYEELKETVLTFDPKNFR